jgi:nucleotide-binding universal stress UspA family protein
MSEVQCPVFIVPSDYKPFDSVTILYDGEPSSVYALKMFNYLFPAYACLPTEVISVRHDEDNTHLPDHHLMKEFLKRHCPHAENVILKGKAEDQIISYLGHEKKHPLIVLGAYRRSRMSRMFRPSMADRLISELNLPLFIAHGK